MECSRVFFYKNFLFRLSAVKKLRSKTSLKASLLVFLRLPRTSVKLQSTTATWTFHPARLFLLTRKKECWITTSNAMTIKLWDQLRAKTESSGRKSSVIFRILVIPRSCAGKNRRTMWRISAMENGSAKIKMQMRCCAKENAIRKSR